jgi:aspartate dehydrogenase
MNLAKLRRPRVIFEGTPAQVVQGFPQNTNVAAALTLALGPRAARKVRVQVVADPGLTRNQHELDVEGEGGRIQCRIESRPSANPKTSELAVLSAIATLARCFSRIVIGT